MTIEHHPEEATLAAYAAGALDLGQRVALATHLRACPRCRAFVRAMERLGGAFSRSRRRPMSADALARTLARLDEPRPRPRAGARDGGRAARAADVRPPLRVRPVAVRRPARPDAADPFARADADAGLSSEVGAGHGLLAARAHGVRDDLRSEWRVPSRRRPIRAGRFRPRRRQRPPPAACRGGRGVHLARRDAGRVCAGGVSGAMSRSRSCGFRQAPGRRMSFAALATAFADRGSALAAIMTAAWAVAAATGQTGWIDSIWTFGVGATASARASPSGGGEGWLAAAAVAVAVAAVGAAARRPHSCAHPEDAGRPPLPYSDRGLGRRGPMRLFGFLQIQAAAGAALALAVALAAHAPSAASASRMRSAR